VKLMRHFRGYLSQNGRSAVVHPKQSNPESKTLNPEP